MDPIEPGQPDQPETVPRERRREARLVLTGIAVVLLVWFAAANLQDVRIHFWVVTEGAPVIVVIAISGFLGALVTGLWSRAARRRRSGSRPG